MKQITLTAALLMGSLCASHAQDESSSTKQYVPPSATEALFRMPQIFINVRDITYLPNKSKVTIELNNPEQYKELSNIDATLKTFLQDIAFYKDSLETGGSNVSIDYAIDEAFPFSKIRFKKHPADGNIFMSKHNDISKLKVDQDTVRIYVRHNPLMSEEDKKSKKKDYYYAHSRQYQLTFCVNNYTDIAKIVTDKELLQHAFDTLYATKRTGSKENPFKVPSSAMYNPYATGADEAIRRWLPHNSARFYRYGGLWDPNKPGEVMKPTDYISSDGNFGIGLLRNTFAPYAEWGLTLQLQGRNTHNEVYTKMILRAFVSSYFLFEQDANKDYKLQQNMFVNADIGESKDISFGVGYLVNNKGNYFKGNTGKVTLNVKMLKKGLTLSPELIFTNDFKEVFPSLTLKVF